ncbi:hypothetical protein [Frankia sp. R82]|uniref:hypothetical protein n=1 Tax=Frankia sp. R82 TaxID=2950553 RepID=UPI0020433F8B|nr:hypothetical protein [Frankia sp. R82]MCM3884476.1 hypothetical protein [Frankia sp. R82]
MNLRVLYRSVGSENTKNRPEYYSKQLALESLLRAAAQVSIPMTIHFVNDGPIPADRLALMADAGEIVPVSCGSNRASYRHVLRLPRLRRWAEDDLIWLAEDDYLYTERSLSALVSVAQARPDVSYFTLYSTLRFASASTRRRPVVEQSDQDPSGLPRFDGVPWARAASTTSTFGVRVAALLEDERLLRAIPFVGGAFDRATCLTLQGLQPFQLAELGGEPPAVEPPTAASRVARRAALTGVRLTLNAVALARSERRWRTMLVPEPSLATHLELGGALAAGHDWAAEAAAVAAWSQARTAAATGEASGPTSQLPTSEPLTSELPMSELPTSEAVATETAVSETAAVEPPTSEVAASGGGFGGLPGAGARKPFVA